MSYTRFSTNIRYDHPVFSRKHIVGLRFAADYVAGSGNNVPFYEFTEIGGVDNLEGFALNRFSGQSRVLAEASFTRELADFDFYNIWRVRLDGSVFGGAGRVFLNTSKLPSNLSRAAYPGLGNTIRYSGGAGLRVSLSEAVRARLDAGFSKENQGLIYLDFGTRF